MQEANAIACFERELEAVGKLDHPNIVRTTVAGDHVGRHYLVMEYSEGYDLSDLVHIKGHLWVADPCETLRQAAVGLQRAHDLGLGRRDIKPTTSNAHHP